MMIGANNEMYTLVGGQLMTLAYDLLIVPATNGGAGNWFYDARRHFGVYTTQNPANNANIAPSTPSLFPSDPANVSIFNIGGSVTLPSNLNFSLNDNGYPCLKFQSNTNNVFVNTTTLNTTNAATGLTAMYRFRLDTVNTINNQGKLFIINDNTNTSERFSVTLDNRSGVKKIFIGVNNIDGNSTNFVDANINLPDIIGKWVGLIIDINYSTRLLRCWINGRLVLSTTVTTMTSGSISNTNAFSSNVIGSDLFSWTGYCSFARITKNASMTNNDAIKLTNQMEILKYNN